MIGLSDNEIINKGFIISKIFDIFEIIENIIISFIFKLFLV